MSTENQPGLLQDQEVPLTDKLFPSVTENTFKYITYVQYIQFYSFLIIDSNIIE